MKKLVIALCALGGRRPGLSGGHQPYFPPESLEIVDYGALSALATKL